MILDKFYQRYYGFDKYPLKPQKITLNMNSLVSIIKLHWWTSILYVIANPWITFEYLQDYFFAHLNSFELNDLSLISYYLLLYYLLLFTTYYYSHLPSIDWNIQTQIYVSTNIFIMQFFLFNWGSVTRPYLRPFLTTFIAADGLGFLNMCWITVDWLWFQSTTPPTQHTLLVVPTQFLTPIPTSYLPSFNFSSYFDSVTCLYCSYLSGSLRASSNNHPLPPDDFGLLLTSVSHWFQRHNIEEIEGLLW